MKKLYFIILFIFILFTSNILAVSSFTNEQKNNVAEGFYNIGSVFLKVEQYTKAKDFFIYSHNEAVKCGNNYLAYNANERIKDCNNMLELDVNDYTITKKLMSKDVQLSSTGGSSEYQRNVTLNVYSYRKHDYLSFNVSQGQTIRFNYQVTKGDVSIYFMDKNSFNKFKNSSYFTYDLSIGGIQLPSKLGIEYTETYMIPETGEWYLLLVTNSADAGELQMDIL